MRLETVFHRVRQTLELITTAPHKDDKKLARIDLPETSFDYNVKLHGTNRVYIKKGQTPEEFNLHMFALTMLHPRATVTDVKYNDESIKGPVSPFTLLRATEKYTWYNQNDPYQSSF